MKMSKRQLRKIINEVRQMALHENDAVLDYSDIVKAAGPRGIGHLDLVTKLLDLGMPDDDEDMLADLMFDDVAKGNLDPIAFEDGHYIWTGLAELDTKITAWSIGRPKSKA